MTNLEESLREKFCPETAGDIILALNEADCHVSWVAHNLDKALVWRSSKQGHEFWGKILVKSLTKGKNISLDIYSL